MSKIVDAEYDAAANALRLETPLEGVADHQKVKVTVETTVPRCEPSLKSLSGSLSPEAAESLSRAVNELFPTWN